MSLSGAGGFSVGSIYGTLGARLEDRGFDLFDRAVASARRTAQRPVVAELRTDHDQRGFDKYDRSLRSASQSAERAERSNTRFFGSVGTWGSRVAVMGSGAAAAAVGVGLLGKTFVGTASDIGESLTKNEQLFGKHSATVDQWSKSTAQAFGISRASALEAAGSYGSLFETIGLADKPAANMSKRLTELAGDLASFNNADPSETLESIKSGLIGEAEPMRRFGALLSETRVLEEAYKAGIAERGAELTEQQKVQARYNLILKDTNAAHGDFARTSGGLPNQIRILKAQFSDAGATIGTKLIPPLLDGTRFLNELFSGGGKGRGAGLASQVRQQVGGAAGAVREFLAPLTDEVGALFFTVRDYFAGIGQAIAEVFSGEGVGSDVRDIARALRAFLEVVLDVYNSVVRRAIPGIVDAFAGLARVVRGVVRIVAGVLTLDFSRAWDGVKDVFGGGVQALGGLLRAGTAPLREAAARAGGALSDAFGAAWDFVKRGFRGFLDFFLGGVSTLLGAVEDVVGVASGLPVIGGKFKGLENDIRGARRGIDEYRESLRETDREQRRQRGIDEARERVQRYRRQLGNLREGTDEYRAAARKLETAQGNLNERIDDARPAAGRARSSLRLLRGNVSGLADATVTAALDIVAMTNDVLTAFGAKSLSVAFKRAPKLKQEGEFRRGGVVAARVSPGELLAFPDGSSSTVPGARTGRDSVYAALPWGTGVFTDHGQSLLRSGASFGQALDRQLPHFARGGLAGMTAAANRVDRAQFPYLWGGGHQATPAPFGPFDCSGAVSYVLQQGGVNIPTMVSGSMMGIGKPGPGAVSVYANPGHVFMSILGRFFGTSGENPGGGAGWFSGGTPGYRSGFTVRHFGADDVTGGVGRIARLVARGGTPVMRAIAQGAADVMRRGANRRLSRLSPIGLGDPGDASFAGIDSAAEFTPFWNRLTGLPRWAGIFGSRIVPRESGWNPRAENAIGLGHRGWYQFDPPTWGQFGRGSWDNAFNPSLATQAAGNVMRTEGAAGLGRWAATAFRRGGVAGILEPGRGGRSRRWGAINRLDSRIEELGRTYELTSRRFDLSEEEFIIEGDENTPPSLNMRAIQRRAGELGALANIREQITAAYSMLARYIRGLLATYRALRERLSAPIGRMRNQLDALRGKKGKENERRRESLRNRLGRYEEALGGVDTQIGELGPRLEEAQYERESSAIDLRELRMELRPLVRSAFGVSGGVALPEWSAPEADAAVDGGETGPSPDQEAIAAQANERARVALEALRLTGAALRTFAGPGDIGAGAGSAYGAVVNPMGWAGRGPGAGAALVELPGGAIVPASQAPGSLATLTILGDARSIDTLASHTVRGMGRQPFVPSNRTTVGL